MPLHLHTEGRGAPKRTHKPLGPLHSCYFITPWSLLFPQASNISSDKGNCIQESHAYTSTHRPFHSSCERCLRGIRTMHIDLVQVFHYCYLLMTHLHHGNGTAFVLRILNIQWENTIKRSTGVLPVGVHWKIMKQNNAQVMQFS